jgi:nitroimidazol reductase NimA-like FMN-containing flavoprotein (pyridoxamine 5'-phosphate oxidase superfamily)
MRRSEFSVDNPSVSSEILRTAIVGYLGILTGDGFPRVIPVNFVAEGTTVYFHGALEGEKADLLKTSPQVTFHANIPYSIIPSYWLAEKHASGATMFFKAVQIDGRAVLLGEAREKARVLQLLMEKYQPEGGYRPVTADEPMYRKPIAETLVVRINPVRVATKVKLGQNYPAATRRRLIELLDERHQGPDLQTAKEMKVMLRH